jgi:hypothetical protein
MEYHYYMSQRALKRFAKNNGLAIALFGSFFIILICLSISGYAHNNNELIGHGQQTISYGQYVVSGEFAEAVFENWESEFLQMAVLVVLTIFLYQKGSADSKKLHGTNEVETVSRYSIIHAATWRTRGRAIEHALYSNSLGLSLFVIFLITFTLHAFGGTSAYNEEAMWHHEQTLSVVQYIATAQFWFESFQNWQSEFLAVGVLLVLSIFLRQRGSPESKPIGSSNEKTGD